MIKRFNRSWLPWLGVLAALRPSRMLEWQQSRRVEVARLARPGASCPYVAHCLLAHAIHSGQRCGSGRLRAECSTRLEFENLDGLHPRENCSRLWQIGGIEPRLRASFWCLELPVIVRFMTLGSIFCFGVKTEQKLMDSKRKSFTTGQKNQEFEYRNAPQTFRFQNLSFPWIGPRGRESFSLRIPEDE